LFLMIVVTDATADRRRQIHWARGGTSGTNEATTKKMLVALPSIKFEEESCVCIVIFLIQSF
jgi:hypothetical protein